MPAASKDSAELGDEIGRLEQRERRFALLGRESRRGRLSGFEIGG